MFSLGITSAPSGPNGAETVCTVFPGAVTLSGSAGDDAKPYQEKQVRHAIEEVEE